MSEYPARRGVLIGSDFVASVLLFVLVFGTEVFLVANGTLPPHFFTFG